MLVSSIFQASQARMASMYEEELDLQQPLFAVHGYDEKKVKCTQYVIVIFTCHKFSQSLW